MAPKMTRKMAKIAKNVYRGYMPPDLPQHRPPNRIKPWWKVLGKPRLTVYPKPEVEEYSAEPEYPPLNDGSKEGLRRQVRLDWYESLKTIPTSEQKLHEIDRHCTHRMAHINNWLPTCNSLPFIKYLTQTHLINSLPVGYDVRSKSDHDAQSGSIDQEPQTHLNSNIRKLILDHIALGKHESQMREGRFFVSKQVRDGNSKSYVSNTFIQNLVNQLRKVLVYETNPQLLDYQIDLSPAIRSWWYHSGFVAPTNQVFYRSRKDEEGNINQMFQMDGSAALNLRSEYLMEPIVDLNDSHVTDTSLVDKSNYTPKYYGAVYKFKWPVALPGFWFEETPKYDCPHTSFLSTDCLCLRNSKIGNFATNLNDVEDCLNGQAILTAFGWANSLAMYHGFTPFQEMDYPMTCQVVTTDGQNWLFNVYQFNSHSFHRDLGGPKRNNVCWSSGMMKLYDDYVGGNFVNVNDDVISLLVKYLSKQVSQEYTRQLDLRPYLHEDQRSQEEKDSIKGDLRKMFEGRTNKWLSHDWQVPEWEHIFFRSKVSRHQIRQMKPKWHIPKPLPPKIFD